VVQPLNGAMLRPTVVLLAVKGADTGQVLKMFAFALPVTLLFAQVGISFFKRLSDDQFRRLLISMMFISGLVLMLREALW